MAETIFWERLSLLCKLREKTVSGVIKDLGLSTSKRTSWENGTVPNGKILVQLVEYFQISADYILGTSDILSPPNGKNWPISIPEDGLSGSSYYSLSLENQKIVDGLIAQLLAAQSPK